MTFVDSYLWRTERFSGSKWQGLLSSYNYNWYHFSSVVVGVSRSLIVSPNAFFQLHLRRSAVIICRPTRTYLHVHEGRNMKLTICDSLSLSLVVPLDAFSHTAVSGAFLQYDSTQLFNSPSNVTLTVGARERVYCLQNTGPVPTSIDWYNPQGQLVSRDGGDEVNQATAGGGRIAYLIFQSYQQSQGGKYECRVVGPGNNLETLSVCIGECHAWGDVCGLLSISVHAALPCHHRWT